MAAVWFEHAGGQLRSVQKPHTVKTTINLPTDTAEVLRVLADARATSITDVLRRAIWLEKFLFDATKAGARVLIEEPDKTLKEIVLR